MFVKLVQLDIMLMVEIVHYALLQVLLTLQNVLNAKHHNVHHALIQMYVPLALQDIMLMEEIAHNAP